MGVRKEIVPFLILSAVIGGLVCLIAPVNIGVGIGLIIAAYMFWFFRDPERSAPEDPMAILAAADGVVAKIVELDEDEYVGKDVIRISIFLSLFSVHVNRAPITGMSKFLGYFPGKRLFTFDEKSSEANQHNAILFTGEHTKCLVKQIVGPVCRRVVYWPDHDAEVPLQAGDRIGMMKFGSRLDMTFPKSDIVVTAQIGQKTTAGETVIAELKKGA